MKKALKVNMIPYFKKEGGKDEILANIDTPLGVQANGVLKHTTGGMKSLGAGIPMNLYLTSDDELKDDDWYLEEDVIEPKIAARRLIKKAEKDKLE